MKFSLRSSRLRIGSLKKSQGRRCEASNFHAVFVVNLSCISVSRGYDVGIIGSRGGNQPQTRGSEVQIRGRTAGEVVCSAAAAVAAHGPARPPTAAAVGLLGGGDGFAPDYAEKEAGRGRRG